MAGRDGAARGLLLVADTVKPTSAQAVRQFRDLGLHRVLLTGDNAAVAQAVAAEVGIEEVVADVLSAEKVGVIKRLRADGRVVAMVGDGMNAAAALAQADLGLAMGTGTDVAIEASDLTLVGGDLRAAADEIRLSRRTLRTIKGNLFWAFAYNVTALPLAVAGLLNPVIAGAAIAFSSVFVVTNSLRLRGFWPLAENRAARGRPDRCREARCGNTGRRRLTPLPRLAEGGDVHGPPDHTVQPTLLPTGRRRGRATAMIGLMRWTGVGVCPGGRADHDLCPIRTRTPVWWHPAG